MQAELYVLKRECELLAKNPSFFAALETDGLALDQRFALYRSLELIPALPRLSATEIIRAVADCNIIEEVGFISREIWGNIASKVARMVGGDKSRRDEVRRRIATALRITRMACVN